MHNSFKFSTLLFFFTVIFFYSCSGSSSDAKSINFEELIEFNYAKGLKIYKTSQGHVVTVSNPSSGEILDHFLVSNKKNSNLSNIKIIQTPSTTKLPKL